MDWSKRAVLTLAVLAAFLLVSFFGVSAIGTDMNPGAASSHCPLMPGMESLCHMDVLGHIAAWQSSFAATSAQGELLAMLLALVALLSFSFLSVLAVFRFELLPARAAPARLRGFQPLEPLAQAFSDGILNTKRY